MTTTTLRPEKALIKAPSADLKIPDRASVELAAVAPVNVSDIEAEPMSNIRLLREMAGCFAASLYLLARSLDDWVSGPPMTEKERARFYSTASELHWKYWARL